MSTGTTSCRQLAAHFDQIKRRFETPKLRSGLQMELLGVAKAVFEMFLINACSSTAKLPDRDEMAKLIQSLLLSLSQVFTDYFFQVPLFTLVTLVKVADLYGCVCCQEALYSNQDLDDQD